jgi:hypothetical protein
MESDKRAPEFDALHVPPAVLEQGGVEVLRAVIVDGALHVSLRRAFDEPEVWGVLIADVARHVGRLYAKETAMTEDEVKDRLLAMFQAEMDNPTDPGTTGAVS